jgi:chemotaxis protein CheD
VSTAARPAAEPASVHPVVYLHAGQLAAFREPRAISTVLGSCVAVCLWDAATRVGGMNHFLLPHRAGAGETSPRFGNVAMGQLLDAVVRLGARFSHLQAKLFGGASVLGGTRPGDTLGEQNVQLARSLLHAAGIPVVAEDTGGTRGRRLVFHTDDGLAFVKRL